MQSVQYQLNRKLPEVKASNIIPLSSAVNYIIGSPLVQKSRPYIDQAKILSEHIDIVKESRETIKMGKVISWDEFIIKNEAKRKPRV